MKAQHEEPKLKSLSLLDVEEYSNVYSKLKTKYGKKMLEAWPECTDPQKFVYEDIAIATYLLLLWKIRHGSDTKVSFVDLGCGNGLLVYILASEGHKGLGIDLRSRKIWDIYPKTFELKVETINPTQGELYPDVNWIIGNHSDELSPWIPVIAARNSSKTEFFLLPCCAYEFNGQKFKRRNASKSVYEDFIEYAKEISTKCGFTFDVDRLKIPSTKRIAIVSCGRKEVVDDKIILSFIEERSKDKGFKARDVVEKVRNCTQIDKTVEQSILLIIFNELLGKKRFIDEYPGWNIGGTLNLGDAIQLISDDMKKILKAESGGLQTLLKNNHSIFEVRKGIVQLRLPVSLAKRQQECNRKDLSFKQKICWFSQNHPNGCPLGEDLCSYKH